MIKALESYRLKGYKINKEIESLPSDEKSCISIVGNIVTMCINYHKQYYEQLDIEAIKNYLNNIK